MSEDGRKVESRQETFQDVSKHRETIQDTRRRFRTPSKIISMFQGARKRPKNPKNVSRHQETPTDTPKCR